MSEPVRFSGAVLTGGRSTRMGTDKALVPVGGIAMAVRVANAMSAAGATDVTAVGGDEDALRSLGLRTIADSTPGEGPLGGILSALRSATESIVVVTACDMPWIDAAQIVPLVDALAHSRAVVTVSTSQGQLQPLHAAWRLEATADLQRMFDSGERAPRRAVQGLECVTVELGDGRWSTDLDTPEH